MWCGVSAFSLSLAWTPPDGAYVDMGFEVLSIDRNGTTDRSDDVYLWSSNAGATVLRKHYANMTSGEDALGWTRTAANVQFDINGAQIPGDGSILTLFDITNVLQGGLDYVQLGMLTNAPGANLKHGFFAFGGTVPDASMPTTGTATYSGGTRGAYTDGAGQTYLTASDIQLTADFGSGAVSGATSNFKMVDDNGAAVTPSYSLDFNFNANISGGGFDGTASNPNLTGTVEGTFHGGPGVPQEAAIGYKLQETNGGGTLVGVGGLRNR